MTSVWILLVVLGAATAFGVWRQRTDGRMREAAPRPVADDAPAAHVRTPDARHHGGEVLTAEVIGSPLGDRATLVQVSSAFCQPCRATQLLLSTMVAELPGVRHVEIDAEQHMDLVRHLDVRRTPTVFVLDSAGAIRNRATGLPRKAEVVAALGQVV